jgi:uncharacterized protein
VPGPLRAPVSAYGTWLGGRLAGMPLATASPLEAVERIAPRPLLLIHGDADHLIPPSDSQEIYDAAGEPKALWLAPGSRHVGAAGDHPEEYRRRVLEFLEEWLRIREEQDGT